MRAYRSIILALLAVCAAHAAAAKTFVRGWEIEPRFENGTLQSCTMTGEYQQGQVFGVLVTKDFKWAITIGDPRWRLTEGARVSAAVLVDGSYLSVQIAKAVSPRVAVIMLSSDQAFRAFQSGNAMTISVNGAPATMSLQGTHAAMTALLNCVATNSSRRPVEIQTGSLQGADSVALTDAEALVMVSNLLSRAGFSGYELQPPSKGIVGWTFADGSKGAFFGFKNFRGSLDRLASDAVSAISEECKGDFASAKKAGVNGDGMETRKISMACSQEGRVQDYYVNVLQVSGFAAVFMHSAPATGAGDQSRLEAKNDSLATQAVITQRD